MITPHVGNGICINLRIFEPCAVKLRHLQVLPALPNLMHESPRAGSHTVRQLSR